MKAEGQREPRGVATETCVGHVQRAPPRPGQPLNAPPSHTWDKTKQIHEVARTLVLTSHGQNVYKQDFADLRKYFMHMNRKIHFFHCQAKRYSFTSLRGKNH